MSFKVHIVQAARSIDVPAGTTILDAALAAGIAYPFGCRSGNCGVCKSELLDGVTQAKNYSEFALSRDEMIDGLILACRAVPLTDCKIAWLNMDEPPVNPRRRLDCRVVTLDDATHDIKRVRLEIVSGGPFAFSAGQFASVTFEGCPPRDYSMANVPGDPILEFHVRCTPGGATAAHVSAVLKPGDIVRVEGPFGLSYLRAAHRGPIIAVAGGSGLAPIKSIVERALQLAMPQPIGVYFGVRSARDLYLHDHFARLAEQHENLQFVPVVGSVHEAIATDFATFDGCMAYLAGPPALVETVAALLEQRGLRRDDIHADAFYTAEEMARAGRKTGADM